jgi:hypothetical protein
MDQRIGRQGGWVGMIVLLLALAIVAWLARDALKGYLAMPTVPATTTKAGAPGNRATGMAGAVGPAEIDPTTATPASQSPLDKARGVDDMVQQQAGRRAGQVDGAAR